MSYFPELCSRSKYKIKVELSLTNYGAKFDFKGVPGMFT